MSLVLPDEEDFDLLYCEEYTGRNPINSVQENNLEESKTVEDTNKGKIVLNDEEFLMHLNPNIDHKIKSSMPSPTKDSSLSMGHIRMISRNDSSLHDDEDKTDEVEGHERTISQSLPSDENGASNICEDGVQSPIAQQQNDKPSSLSLQEQEQRISSLFRDNSSTGTLFNSRNYRRHGVRNGNIRRPSPITTRKYNHDKISASIPALPAAPTRSFESTGETGKSSFEESTPRPRKLINIDQSELNENDVLCGRGGGTNTYIGNRRYRAIVQSYQPQYLKLKRKEKPLMACEVVKVIRSKGGRFLKRDSVTQLWNDIGNEKAEAKTGQALREGLDVRAMSAAASNLMSSKSPVLTPKKKSPPDRRTIMVSGLQAPALSPMTFSPNLGPSLPKLKRTRFKDDMLFPSEPSVPTDPQLCQRPSLFEPPKPSIKKVKYSYDHVITKPRPMMIRPPYCDDQQAQFSASRSHQGIFRSRSNDRDHCPSKPLTPGQFEYWNPSRSWSENNDDTQEVKWEKV